MKTFILCFVPLFVAMDVIGNLPVFIAMTSDFTPAQNNKVVRLAGLTAVVVGLLFMLGGKTLFALLHVSPADFKIAGGLVLFIIAVSGVMYDDPPHAGVIKEHVGVVPIGVPLMVGPATLVTLLLLSDMYPVWAVSVGLIANIVLTLLIFRTSHLWEHLLHANGIRAISKVVHLLLGAIAVMMIRVGIMEIITQWAQSH